ncbi:MAG: gfo/Idh/MocA family oxidoreductase [Acidobacteriales bacterium]|nr:MAG: gfo/Idh/MocA family oxidoreductase [Terriglobales bacterium]
MERRDFLRKSVSAGVTAWTAVSASRVLGANDRLNVGLIGCGGRGTFDARLMRGTPEDIQAVAPENYHDGNLDPRLKEPRNVDIMALCDCYGSRMDSAKKWTPQAKTYDDFRKLLADKSVDAVIIATQDQWHAQMMILACEAGKDVYLEKPVVYRVGEAQAMINAVRRNKRIVQIGTQHRAADHMAEAARIVQGGKLGEVQFVRVWNYMAGGFGSQPVPDSEPPADLNWDAWLGPAPKVPFNRSRLSYRSFMDYTNGIISDYGNHRFDTVHQIMGQEIPLTVASSAVRFRKQRAGDIYDMQQATYEYPNFIMSYESSNYNGHGVGGRTEGMRYYGMRGSDDRPHGMAFYGTDATLFVDRIGMELYPEGSGGPRGAGRRGGGSAAAPAAPSARPARMHMNEDEPTPLHTKYFVDNVRARKDPFANIEVGARATAIACMGNVAYWTGRKLKWDPKTWSFVGDAEANKHTFRPNRKPWDLVKFSS